MTKIKSSDFDFMKSNRLKEGDIIVGVYREQDDYNSYYVYNVLGIVEENEEETLIKIIKTKKKKFQYLIGKKGGYRDFINIKIIGNKLTDKGKIKFTYDTEYSNA